LFIERVWRSIKYEDVYLHAYETVSAARDGIGGYINFYNTRRPHSSHQARTPDVVYFRIAASAFGRRSLTPQSPLKSVRNLFRSTGRVVNERYQQSLNQPSLNLVQPLLKVG